MRPFAEIVEAYFDGLFDVCLGALPAHATPAGAALAARSQMRVGRPARALAAIEAVIGSDATTLTHAELGELETLRFAALVRLGRSNEPETQVANASARAHVYSAMLPALEADLAYVEAYAVAIRGDLTAAENAAKAVLTIEPDPSRTAYVLPLAHSRARAYDLLAFLAARREDDDSRHAYLHAALDESAAATPRDAVFEANVLVNLAIFARERGDAGGFVRARLERLGDAEHLESQRYEILRCLAWANGLEGNHLGAFRDLRDASELAPTLPLKIRATLDRAFFASELGQDLIAREETDYALRLSERVNWNDVASDECELEALLQLATMLARFDPVRGRSIFERYRRLRAKISPDRVGAKDRRARAEMIGAEAAFARAAGDVARARDLLLEAFATWHERGCPMRAAVVARELSELGAGAEFAAYVAREVAARPQSWFAVSVGSAARTP